MVVGDGFEPSKAVPADLQSAPFSHSGIPPNGAGKGGRTPLTSLEGWCTADMPYPQIWYRRWESNPQALRHTDLNRARLPIPPRRQKLQTLQKI